MTPGNRATSRRGVFCLSRGLDPNASFRNPVDRQALKQPAKILVECDVLEEFIRTYFDQIVVGGYRVYEQEANALLGQISAARAAQNPGMRNCERCGAVLEPREGHYCGEAQK